MGRAANGLDWIGEGSGVGRKARRASGDSSVSNEPRPDSELRLRAQRPEQPANHGGAFVSCDGDDADPPTCRFDRSSSKPARDTTDALSARGIARLSALADWLDGEEPSGAVVSLVRKFLDDMRLVGSTMDVLVEAAEEIPLSGVYAAVHSLTLAVGLWRSNLVEHVDDLALSNYRSLSGWSSVPEYAYAYALAIVEPALAEAEAWALAKRGPDVVKAEDSTAVNLAACVRAVRASVRRLTAALRTAIASPDGASENGRAEGSLLTAAW